MASEGKMPGDIVNKSGNYSGGGAAEEYYKFALLKAKADALSGDEKARASRILGAQSEREVIELQVLDKLVKLGESSPEFSQVAEITGSREKFEMARVLAEIVYDKARAESILGFYTPTKASLNEHFLKRTAESFSVRGTVLADAMKASPLGPVAAAFAGLFPAAAAQ